MPLDRTEACLVRDFWAKVFYPIAERRLASNTKAAYKSAWRTHIEPAIGSLELQHVVKHAIEAMLGKMADTGLSAAVVRRALVLAHEMFVEAVENGYIAKNPARKIILPRCRPAEETTSLTEQQVRAIFENTEGRDRLMWRLLILTNRLPAWGAAGARKSGSCAGRFAGRRIHYLGQTGTH